MVNFLGTNATSLLASIITRTPSRSDRSFLYLETTRPTLGCFAQDRTLSDTCLVTLDVRY